MQLKNQPSGLKARRCKSSEDLFAGTEYITYIQKCVHVYTQRHLCIYFVFNFNSVIVLVKVVTFFLLVFFF